MINNWQKIRITAKTTYLIVESYINDGSNQELLFLCPPFGSKSSSFLATNIELSTTMGSKMLQPSMKRKLKDNWILIKLNGLFENWVPQNLVCVICSHPRHHVPQCSEGYLLAKMIQPEHVTRLFPLVPSNGSMRLGGPLSWE